MKKVNVLLIMCFIASALFLGGCRKNVSDDALTHIPENASMLMAINPSRMLEKADFAAIKDKPEYQKMIAKQAKENPSLAAIMQDPANSGVDLTKNIYFTTIVDPASKETFTGVVFSIADADKFAKMAKGSVKDIEVSSKSGFSVLRSLSNFTAWNGNVGYSGVMTGDMAETLLTGGGKSLADNAKVQKALGGSHDVSTWFSTDALAQMSDLQMGAATLGIEKEALLGNSVHGYLDFENGEIRGHSDFFLQQVLRDEFGILFKSGVKTDFSGLMSDEPAITFTAAIDFAGVEQFLKEKGPLASLADMQAESSGIPVRFADITKALDGDIMVQFSPTSANKERSILAAKVRDVAHLKTLIAMGEKAGMLKKEAGNVYSLSKASSSGLFMTLAGDMLVISPEKGNLMAMVTKFSLGNTATKPALAAAKSNTFTMRVSPNLEIPGAGMLGASSKMPSSEGFDMTMNGQSADFKIPMTDKKKNALKAILEAANATTTSGQ